MAVPALLILKQPDLGTTLVVGAILTAELAFGLPNVIDFAIYLGCVLAGAAYVLSSDKILKPFQRARLLVFLNPKLDPLGAGYNLNQSKIAVGSGELLGKGLYHGTQTQLNFVPENSRDFIFTALGEEAGFLGACVLIALNVAIVAGAMRAVFSAQDRFGLLLSIGLVTMLAFHMIVNIGMTIGIMPITGIPLPFMSYGGSALITDYLAVGILINIALQKDRLVFGDQAAPGRSRRLTSRAERPERGVRWAKRNASPGGIGRAKEVALHEPAAQVVDERSLLDRLDAFGDHLGAESARERDDPRDDRHLGRIVRGRDDERAVDLDRVDAEVVEVT